MRPLDRDKRREDLPQWSAHDNHVLHRVKPLSFCVVADIVMRHFQHFVERWVLRGLDVLVIIVFQVRVQRRARHARPGVQEAGVDQLLQAAKLAVCLTDVVGRVAGIDHRPQFAREQRGKLEHQRPRGRDLHKVVLGHRRAGMPCAVGAQVGIQQVKVDVATVQTVNDAGDGQILCFTADARGRHVLDARFRFAGDTIAALGRLFCGRGVLDAGDERQKDLKVRACHFWQHVAQAAPLHPARDDFRLDADANGSKHRAGAVNQVKRSRVANRRFLRDGGLFLLFHKSRSDRCRDNLRHGLYELWCHQIFTHRYHLLGAPRFAPWVLRA